MNDAIVTFPSFKRLLRSLRFQLIPANFDQNLSTFPITTNSSNTSLASNLLRIAIGLRGESNALPLWARALLVCLAWNS